MTKKGVGGVTLTLLIMALMHIFGRSEDPAGAPKSLVFGAIACMIAGYWLRTNYPGGYGMLEMGIAVLGLLALVGHEAADEAKVAILGWMLDYELADVSYKVFGAVYIGIRALDNVSRTWTAESSKRAWDRIWGTTLAHEVPGNQDAGLMMRGAHPTRR
jgi:hypothetical protein